MQPIADMRKEYEDQGLARSDMAADPVAQFQHWFKLATDDCPAPWLEPNAMTLATVDKQGQPTSRIVLLKGVEGGGFVFFTNYLSRKGHELIDNPLASLNFHWPWQGRQVRIDGVVEKISTEASSEYFHSRPHGSQLGAHVSEQSQVIEDRAVLEQRFAQLQATYAEGEVPRPAHWGGYLLMPTELEFWQGRSSRLHDRFRYRLLAGKWQLDRLAP